LLLALDAETGAERFRFTHPRGHHFEGLALSPNAGLLAAVDERGMIYVFDTAGGAVQPRGSFNGQKTVPRTQDRPAGLFRPEVLTFSPDGRTLWAGGLGTVAGWQVETLLK
jgi:hypothetical protein